MNSFLIRLQDWVWISNKRFESDSFGVKSDTNLNPLGIKWAKPQQIQIFLLENDLWLKFFESQTLPVEKYLGFKFFYFFRIIYLSSETEFRKIDYLEEKKSDWGYRSLLLRSIPIKKE